MLDRLNPESATRPVNDRDERRNERRDDSMRSGLEHSDNARYEIANVTATVAPERTAWLARSARQCSRTELSRTNHREHLFNARRDRIVGHDGRFLFSGCTHGAGHKRGRRIATRVCVETAFQLRAGFVDTPRDGAFVRFENDCSFRVAQILQRREDDGGS